MNKFFIIIIFLFSHIYYISSQSKMDIELSEGFVFYDYFSDNPNGYEKLFSGYGLQTEIDIWTPIYTNERIDFNAGVGFTRFGYSYAYGFSFIGHESRSTPYINMKIGVIYKPIWSKLNFMLNSTNYFLLLREKQQYSQNRWFSNIDIGFRVNILKKIKFSAWSPITIRPMHDGALVSRPIDVSFNYNPWIEIIGLNIGILYSIF